MSVTVQVRRISRVSANIAYVTLRHFNYLFCILNSSSQRKHALRWLRSLRRNYLLDAPSPWIVFDAIDFLSGYVKPDMRVFEYGSGGSTLYWLQFGAEVISVEHDPGWSIALNERLDRSASVDYKLVEPQLVASSSPTDPSDPAAYGSGDAAYRRHSFRQYVTQIDRFPDHHFDIVLVDGRARPSCVAHSASKVKVGGLLILDNADTPYYTMHTDRLLNNFEARHFYGVGPCGQAMWRTDIYARKD